MRADEIPIREVSMPTHTTVHRVERATTPLRVVRQGETTSSSIMQLPVTIRREDENLPAAAHRNDMMTKSTVREISHGGRVVTSGATLNMGHSSVISGGASLTRREYSAPRVVNSSSVISTTREAPVTRTREISSTYTRLGDKTTNYGSTEYISQRLQTREGPPLVPSTSRELGFERRPVHHRVTRYERGALPAGINSRVIQVGGSRTVREGIGRLATPVQTGGIILGGTKTEDKVRDEMVERLSQQARVDGSSSSSSSSSHGNMGAFLMSSHSETTHRRLFSHSLGSTPRQRRTRTPLRARASSISYIRNVPATNLQANESLVAPDSTATPSRVTIMNGNVVPVYRTEEKKDFASEVHTIWR